MARQQGLRSVGALITLVVALVMAAMGASRSDAAAMLSVNFVGSSGVSPTLADSAGASGYVSANWNNLAGANGTSTSILDGTGATLAGLTVTYGSPNTWQNGAATTTPDGMVMRGYLDSGANSPYVYLSGVPYGIFDVVVYADGDATAAGSLDGPYVLRYGTSYHQTGGTTEAAINTTNLLRSPVWLREPGNFSGAYTQVPTIGSNSAAAAQSGNYMVFSGIRGDFTIDPTQTTGNPASRAPLNAFQIVRWDTTGTLAGAGASDRVALGAGDATLAASQTIGGLATSVGTAGNLTINPGVVLTLAEGQLNLGDIDHSIGGGGAITSNTNTLTIYRDISVGAGYASGAGSVVMEGISLVDNGATPLNLIKTGSGEFVFRGTASHTGTTRIIGGTLTFGGNASVANTTYLGNNSPNVASTLNIADNAVITTSSQIVFGDQFNAAITVNQSGGTVTNNGTANDPAGNNMANRWGHWGGGTTTYNLSDGALNLAGAPLYLSWDGPATLNISGGTANLRGIDMGYGTRGNASTINLNGGTLNIGAAGIVTGGTANKNINLNGGTLGALAAWSSNRPMTLSNTPEINSGEFTITLSGALSGWGGLAKTGNGTLVLSGASTYGGDTAVKAGTLSAATIDASGGSSSIGNAFTPVVLGDTATQGTLNYTGAAVTYTRGLTLMEGGGRINNSGSGLLTIDVGAITSTVDGSLAMGGAGSTLVNNGIDIGAGSLTKADAGMVTLAAANDYEGGTTVNGGTLMFLLPEAIGGSGRNVAVAAGAVVGTGYPIDNAFLNRLVESENAFTVALGADSSQDLDLSSPTGATLPNVSLGAVGATPYTYSGTLTPGSTTYRLGGGGGTLVYTPAITGANSLLVGGNGTGGTVVLTSDNDYSGGTTIAAGSTLQLGSGGATGAITGNVTNNGTLTFNRGADLDFNGVISGAGALVKQGSGKVTLTADATNTGNTTVNGGTLSLGTAMLYSTNAWAARQITVTGGATVEIGGWGDAATAGLGQVAFAPANILINGGTIRYLGGRDGGNLDRGFTIGAGGATLEAAGGANTFQVLYGRNVNVDTPSGGLLTLAGPDQGILTKPVGGTGGLAKTGAGTWTLGAANTYTGPTTLNAGTLRVGHLLALQNSTVTPNGGNLELGGITAILGGLAGSGNLDLGANPGMMVGNNNAATTYSGGLAGSAALVKIGSGTLTLSGANTHSGGTVVQTGTVRFDAATAASATGKILVLTNANIAAGYGPDQTLLDKIDPASTGTLGLTADSAANLDFSALGALSLGALANSTYGGALTPADNTYRLGGGGASLTLANPLGGDNGLVVRGPGIVTLSNAAQTLTGATTINGGVLQLTGNAGAILDNVNGIAVNGSAITTSAVLSGTLRTGALVLTGGDLANRLGSTPVTLNGGSLAFYGTAVGAETQNVASLNLDNGMSTVYVAPFSASGPDTLAIANLSRPAGAGATVNFQALSGTLGGAGNDGRIVVTNLDGSPIANSNGILGGWAVAGAGNATAFATHVDAVGGIAAATPGKSTASAALSASAATDNWLATGGVAANNTITADLTINSLIEERDVFVNNGATLTVASGGLIFRAANFWMQTNAGTVGKVTSGLPSGELFVHTPTTFESLGDQYIRVVIADNITGDGWTPVSLVKDGVGALKLNQANTFSGGTFINAGRVHFDNAGSTGSGPITVRGGGQAFLTGGVTYANAFNIAGIGCYENAGYLGAIRFVNGAVVSGGVILAADARLTAHAANETGTISGSIDGPYGIEKAGAGTVVLSGWNSHTGTTTVAAGTLQIGAGGSTGSIEYSTINVLGNATLAFNRSDAFTHAALITGSGAVTKLGTGTLTLTAANTYLGPTNVNAGALEFSALEQLGAGRVINLNGGMLRYAWDTTVDVSTARVLNLNGGGIDTNGNDITLAGTLAGPGGLGKYGAGTLALTADNPYIGGTRIEGGTLSVEKIADSGPSNIGPNVPGDNNGNYVGILNGILRYTGAAAATTVRNFWTDRGNGTLDVVEPAARLELSGAYVGNTAYVTTKSGPGTLALTGVVNNPSLRLAVAEGLVELGKESAAATAVGAIADIAEGAVVRLTGAGGDQIYHGDPVNWAVAMSGGTLDLNGHDETIPTLNSFVPQSTVTNDGADPATLTINVGATAGTFAGTITDGQSGGAIAVTKIGGGLQVFSGANAYSGGTLVNGGTLEIASADALPAGRALTIGAGGTVVLGEGLAAASGAALAASSSAAAAVPEPGTLAMLATALIAALAVAWRRRK